MHWDEPYEAILQLCKRPLPVCYFYKCNPALSGCFVKRTERGLEEDWKREEGRGKKEEGRGKDKTLRKDNLKEKP